MTSLLDPIQIGAIKAPNRIFMAPMTRARGTREHVPTEIMVDYYRQRASAGLIISEAVGITQQGLGWPYATGLWTPEQIAGWRKVTDAVHEAGGRIMVQLWHMGRTVHSSFLDGERPVSASATTAPSHAHTYDGRQPYDEARHLDRDEISAIVKDFHRGAMNAIEAGFDGAQIHAANGYLIDQFLRDSANFRDDEYGGSLTNRIRLLREVTEAVADAIGADRTGVRLSPNGETQGVSDSDPVPLFAAALEALSALGIGHLELREPPVNGTFGVGDMAPLAPQLRPFFKGPLLLNSDFNAPRAQADLDAGIGDAVTFGRAFISNPDLPRRIAEGIPLAMDDAGTWFTQGSQGYTDYPAAA
ncbi:alkene reductase [Sphingomonas xinjiangensis]|uniref:2,4-dienoyl-CoA reductase-like NADH-dependent reductase (Old Yellow Enzyme family) n=1 Tax=Sphingomonas xinjiangensis TaxID=643568 RepID=A0A840YHK0_9SPHN|nr:alkene reductase [Sphingomonas xinjiangensis]MBB5711835.1 2,4-dienoyl-CoA reductase-like NADH-dependent reductase (Old Yellow Enzyme family) [Sphingomonas xinjiangensis]